MPPTPMSRKAVDVRVKNATTEVKKEVRNLVYQFTDVEKLAIGQKLGEAYEEHRQAESDEKRMKDDWKSRISAIDAKIGLLSNAARSGYEYRDIDVEITINEPPGKKTIKRLDNGAVVEILPLTATELQRNLEFEAGAEKDKNEAAPGEPSTETEESEQE